MRFATDPIFIAYDDPGRPTDAPRTGRSRAKAQKVALRLAATLSRHPDRFEHPRLVLRVDTPGPFEPAKLEGRYNMTLPDPRAKPSAQEDYMKSWYYAEIANVLGQSETNCRQILRRAKQHVGDMRRRFDASAREHDDLLKRFIQATRSGDMQGLVELLSSEVVLHTDGGGKAIALATEVRGAEKVAGTIIERMRTTLPENLVARMARINGKPGLVSYLNGKPFSALTVDFSGGLAQAIYVVTNPE